MRLAPAAVASFFRLSSSADIAQLVEQVIRNDQVIGSSPIVGSRREAKSSAWQAGERRGKQVEGIKRAGGATRDGF